MKRALLIALIMATVAPLGGCVVAPYPRGVWVPAHWTRAGFWVPGHWA